MTALREVMARLDEVVLGKKSQIRLALPKIGRASCRERV